MARVSLYLHAILYFFQCTGAFSLFDYEGAALKGNTLNASLLELPERPLKFNKFYPQLDEVLQEISTGVCLVSLQAYQGNITARREVR